MEILSISIDRESLMRLNGIQRKLGFRSRSKMLRSALQSLIKDYEKLESLQGNVESVFVLTYADGEKNYVSDMLHMFERDISSAMHHHHASTCVDILSMHASADTTRKLFGAAKSSRSIKSVTCTVVDKR
ncbi:MAG: ribbon-helix-helix protein, CopG family [Candidatus Micrarchaeota archaeon]|nr:ribbon-helix-helix protein, CopG family [Candidatus Micrarchaeota archaeon]